MPWRLLQRGILMKRTKPGDVYGKLTVFETWREPRLKGHGWKYLSGCRCDCGETRIVETGNLRSPNGPRCCHSCSSLGRAMEFHGHSSGSISKAPVEHKCYNTWRSMKKRCQDPADHRYPDYGGRGISVCERWSTSYEAFVADMGLPHSLQHQIDRKDNHGGYHPENCRWVDRFTNARNKRNNRVITAFGKTKTLVEWASETGLKRETIARRLNIGQSPEKALRPNLSKPGKARSVICPAGEFETITDCAKATGKSISTVYGRINSPRQTDWRYAN